MIEIIERTLERFGHAFAEHIQLIIGGRLSRTERLMSEKIDALNTALGRLQASVASLEAGFQSRQDAAVASAVAAASAASDSVLDATTTALHAVADSIDAKLAPVEPAAEPVAAPVEPAAEPASAAPALGF